MKEIYSPFNDEMSDRPVAIRFIILQSVRPIFLLLPLFSPISRKSSLTPEFNASASRDSSWHSKFSPMRIDRFIRSAGSLDFIFVASLSQRGLIPSSIHYRRRINHCRRIRNSRDRKRFTLDRSFRVRERIAGWNGAEFCSMLRKSSSRVN